MSSHGLSIGDLVARTGVTEPTLRMWERRHGFPQPTRTTSGHRRYDEEQVDMVRRVVAQRRAGLSLPAAIERVQAARDPRSLSLFATLRRHLPELEAQLIGKRPLIALSHAIEDERLARAERQILFGCFQRERFYRHEQARWRELSESAEAAAVFADFEHPADPARGPAEIPVLRGQPLAREWAVVFYGERTAIALVGREPASSELDADSQQRAFEAVWTVQPEAVRTLARMCAEATAATVPGFQERAAERLAVEPTGGQQEQLGLATAVINRTLSELEPPYPHALRVKTRARA